MRGLLLTSLFLSLMLAGCECESHGVDAGPPEVDAGQDCSMCDPVCEDAIRLRVQFPAGTPSTEVMVMGATLNCRPEGAGAICTARTVQPGMYEVTLTADGFQDQQIFFTVGPQDDPDDCCSCLQGFSQLIMMSPI